MMIPLALILSFVALARSAPSGSKVVIAQMFEWTWNSVAAECTSFLGPAGYGFVQVSPAQEHIQGTQWWTDYQAVSYQLISKRGTREQYQSMIQTCHAAGVKVIADTIWNHMTGIDSGVGVAGTSFTHYNYPGLYSYENFHHCGLEPNDDIVNFNSEQEVWTCQLVGLADLATDSEYVRSKLAGYTNDLISLGIDGLRLDAAKHMNPADIANITSRLTKKPYITQEVVFGAGQQVTPALYINTGDVQEFRYKSDLVTSFLTNGISSLQNLDNLGWVPGSDANTFVCNQDTERDGSSLNAYSPSNTYTLATVFSLAHPYGTPTVLSSFTNFFHTDAGAPNGGAGACTGNVGIDGWFCQHRWPAIAGMVKFRKHVGSAPLTSWVSPSYQRIAFARGSLGFVAINNMDTPWTTTFATGLPGGSYCNVIDGSPTSLNVCSGSSYVDTLQTPEQPTFDRHDGPRQAIAMHTSALGSGHNNPTAQQVPVLFSENATTTFGQNIFVVGSVPQLGSWNTDNAIPLNGVSYPVWGATVYLPPNTAFEFKFIRKESNGNVVWESDPNRQDTTPSSGVQLISASWR
ncbi:glycoside hydrolase [Lactifluus volemus]|nr:glycoside hydrolase [Lactifluus volemus]